MVVPLLSDIRRRCVLSLCLHVVDRVQPSRVAVLPLSCRWQYFITVGPVFFLNQPPSGRDEFGWVAPPSGDIAYRHSGGLGGRAAARKLN